MNFKRFLYVNRYYIRYIITIAYLSKANFNLIKLLFAYNLNRLHLIVKRSLYLEFRNLTNVIIFFGI